MIPLNPDTQEKWNALHLELKKNMQQEIALMRELLANFHQEELSLMFQDTKAYHQLVEQKGDMLENLSHIRLTKNQTQAQLFMILGISASNGDLNQVLPDNEAITCEILSLKEQLIALSEKMNRQQSRNQHLTEHPEHLLSLHNRSEALKGQIQKKRKTLLATYQIKK